jgi:endonuclease/exonuclease/phosphatase family metal-dependent hydrolase
MSDIGDLHSDRRVRVAGGGQLRGEVRLPDVDGLEPVHDPVVDRLGRLVAEHPLLLGTGVLSGGFAGAATGASGVLGRALRGVAGASAGLAGAMAIGWLAGQVAGTNSPTTGAFVDQVAQQLDDVHASGPPEHLRVMGWNVKELIGDREQVRTNDDALDTIAAAVRQQHPDVLVLQEVSDGSVLGGFHDDLDELRDKLGATDAVLVPNGITVGGKEKGQAVLTFGDTHLQDARGLRHDDPLGSDLPRRLHGGLQMLNEIGLTDRTLGHLYQPRTTADTMLTTPAGTAVRLLAIHLSGNGPHTGGTPGSTVGQERQLVPLADTVDAWDGPTLVTGDFNTNGGTEYGDYEAQVFGDVGLHDAFTQVGITPGDRSIWSIPSWKPTRNIDRLYTSKDVSVDDARILDDDSLRTGSDHLPLVADIEID